MVVDGRVPPAAGLSSSSALTVSTAMAFMAVNGLELDPLETATMVARSERYVGTHGGGMDQAASILGRRDHALFIEFDPLRVRAIKMPANAALVVADTPRSRGQVGEGARGIQSARRRMLAGGANSRPRAQARRRDNSRRRGSRNAGVERGEPCRETRGGSRPRGSMQT